MSSSGYSIVSSSSFFSLPAARKGIRYGDVVLSVQNQRVATVDDVLRVLKDLPEDRRGIVLLYIHNESGAKFITIKMKE